METSGTGILIPIIATVIGSHGLLAVVLVGIALRMGGLPTRKEFNDLSREVTNNKEELSREIAVNKEELSREIAANKEELRREIAANKEELRSEIVSAESRLRSEIDKAKNEVLQEIRRSHQQIIIAVANHTHNADGQAVFTLPPDTELVPAPADN